MTRDGTLRQLLRRQSPALQRQRREGDGQRPNTATTTVVALFAAESLEERSTTSGAAGARDGRLAGRSSARFDRRAARGASNEVERLTADHRRRDRAGAGGGALLRARGSSTASRTSSVAAPASRPTARCRRSSWRASPSRAPGSTSEQGLLSHHCTLEMGVSSPAHRGYLQPGEPVVVMGPTGAHRPRSPKAGVGAARRRRSGERRALLDRQARSRTTRQPSVALLRGLQERRRPLQAARRSKRRPTRSIWCHRHRRRPSRPGGAIRIGTSAGTSCRRWWPTPRRASAGRARWCSLSVGLAHHRHRLRSHDGTRCRDARHGVLALACSRRITSPSAASTRRCSA